MDEVTSSTLTVSGILIPVLLTLGVIGCSVAVVAWLVRLMRPGRKTK